MGSHHNKRIALLGLLGLGGISAVAGFIGLIGGGLELAEGTLEGTPFSSSTIPALILGIVVGGSQIVAMLALLRHTGRDLLLAGAAGCVMVGWIVGEVLLLGSDPGIMRALQTTYLINGLLEVGLASSLLRSRPRATAHP